MPKVFAEVTGSVWKVETVAGQAVQEGDTLVIVESMKMEIPVCAPVAGVVRAVLVTEGDTVTDDQVVVEIG